MSQDNLKKIKSTQSDTVYFVNKNRKTERKLDLKKYDPVVRKHVQFKETKK